MNEQEREAMAETARIISRTLAESHAAMLTVLKPVTASMSQLAEKFGEAG